MKPVCASHFTKQENTRKTKKQRLPHTCRSGMGRVPNVFACLQLPSLTRLSSPASESIEVNESTLQPRFVISTFQRLSPVLVYKSATKKVSTSNSWKLHASTKKCLVRRHFCCQQSLSRIVALQYNSTVDCEGKGKSEEGNAQIYRRHDQETSKSGVQVPPLHLHLFWNLPPQVGNDRAKAKHTCTHPSYNSNPYGFAVLHGFPLFVVGSCTNQVNEYSNNLPINSTVLHPKLCTIVIEHSQTGTCSSGDWCPYAYMCKH